MIISNGIVQDKTIGGVPVVSSIVSPKGSRNVRTLKLLSTSDGNPTYIVVHNTGNSASSADARAHYSWLQGVENSDSSYVSVHFFVDEDEAVQTCPVTEMTYHAGDGSTGKGNSQGLSIEICENNNYQKAEKNAIRVIRALMDHFGIPIDRVQPHRYFAPNKKLCPHLILKSENAWQSNWSAFQQHILDSSDDSAPSQPSKSVDEIAREVIAGKWGNGSQRKERLTAAGYDYAAVQAKVNELMGGGSSGSPSAAIAVGDTVRITCNAYSTGQAIPSWVKNTSHKVSQIKGDKALLGYPDGIASWVPLSGIVRA
nr:N-acetylmuramoyl-L-alanine amidase [uncultured Solibaculum sp.]